MVYWCDCLTLTLRARVRYPPSPVSFVLQLDTLSTLLLSAQVYKWEPGRMQTLLWLNAPVKWQLDGMLPRPRE